jgi:hypothetical protein
MRINEQSDAAHFIGHADAPGGVAADALKRGEAAT